MSKFEKRLVLFAIVFVTIYLGAAALTLHRRFAESESEPLRYESEVPTKAEARLGMVELLLPMLVLLTLAVTYALVKKKRAVQLAKLDDPEDETPDGIQPAPSPVPDKYLQKNPEGVDRSPDRHL